VTDLPGNEGSPAPEPSAYTPPPFQPLTPSDPSGAGAYQTVNAAAAPAAAAPPQGMSTLKIILIIVAIFVFLGVLALGVVGYGLWSVSHAIHRNLTDKGVTVNTPNGSISTTPGKTYSATELGVDPYPGALPGKGGMHMSMGNVSITAANYLSTDAKQQVVDFYKTRLGSQAVATETDDSAAFSVKKPGGDMVTVSITQRPGQYDGKTQIHIVHTVTKGS